MKEIILGCCIILSSCLNDRTVIDKDTQTDTSKIEPDVGKDIADVDLDIGRDTKVDIEAIDMDTTVPTIISTTPEDSAVSIVRDSAIRAIFSEDILVQTVDALSFTLKDSDDVNISGSVTFDGANNTAIFTPDEPFEMLVEYTAMLNTSITDLDGNALAADFNWSFTTADGAWSGATQLSTGESPQIAFDNNGNAIVVWSQSDGTRDNIWAKRFDGNTWSTEELIESDNAGSASKPQIAFDTNGNALVVWTQSDGTRLDIWSNRFDGTNWGTAVRIDTGSEDARSPQIAFDTNGNAAAVWQQSDGTRDNIWSNRFDGTSWGNAERIETDNAGDARDPQIDFDKMGNAIAVWSQSDGTVFNIWANRFDTQTWGLAKLIETFTGNGTKPQIAFNNIGEAVAIWAQSEDIATNSFAGNQWRNAGMFQAYGRDPQIVNDNIGGYGALWAQRVDGGEVFATRFSGNIWANEISIDAEDSGLGDESVTPQIEFDARGNAVAVWSKDDDEGGNVWANRFTGRTWLGAVRIVNNNYAHRQQIALDNKGNAIAVWEMAGGIWSNRFK